MTKSFKIRDRRNKGWFYLDNEYINGYGKIFGAIGTAIYVSLCRHADNETQRCYPSMELIADELWISRNTVAKYIKLFEKYKLIVCERERDSKTKKWINNSYYLLDKSEWITHAQPVSMDSHAQMTSTSHAQPLSNKETQDTKETKIATNVAPFIFEEYLETMENHPKRYIQLIAFYFKEKKIKFTSKAQIESAIKRHLRAAKAVEPFSDNQIIMASRGVAKEYPDWTIETLLKKLTR